MIIATPRRAKVVAIVDDDESVQSGFAGLMKEAGLPAWSFASAEGFLGHLSS
jgi:FixJ family two-component response regulator